MASSTLKDEMVSQLREFFGDTIKLDTIRKVANECEYDMNVTSNKLLEMSISTQSRPAAIKQQPKSKLNLSLPLSSSSSSPALADKSLSKKALDIEQVIGDVNKGFQVMIILRGLPGSGKSYLARQILDRTLGTNSENIHIFSTDDYFYDKRGQFKFNKHDLDKAHSWNHNRVFSAVSRGVSPVIIDNTNTNMWEMQAYVTMATDCGYIISILEPDTIWSFNLRQLASRNQHGVPIETIHKMMDRYTKHITPTKLLSAYHLKYRIYPPVFRKVPPIPAKTKVTSSMSLDEHYHTSAHLCKDAHPKQKNKSPIETINLINFTEDASASSTTTFNSGCGSEGNWNSRNLFKEVENDWGVNEDALRSWDLHTPIMQSESTRHYHVLSEQENLAWVQPKQEKSSNTSDDDFRLLNGANNSNEIKILYGESNNINSNTPLRLPKIPVKSMLDKGSQTDDLFDSMDNNILILSNLFPNIPSSSLHYWLDKCNGNLEVTTELLLDENPDTCTLIENQDKNEPLTQVQAEVVKAKDEAICSNATSSEEISANSSNCYRSTPDELFDLKRTLESKVNIPDQFYSDKLLKVKHGRGCVKRKITNSSEVMDSYEDFDDFYPTTNVDDDDNASSANEMMELSLGDEFVSQLENKFGDPSLTYPKGFQPVVQVPVHLARQLYTFYIESVYQQMEAQNQIMDKLSQEDEEFARKLQAQDEQQQHNLSNITKAPNLQNIMHEQLVQNLHRKEIEQWKTVTVDSLADKLSKQKLCNTFPNIERDVLLELLHVHGHNYQETVDSVIASVGSDNVNAVWEPPLNEEIMNELTKAEENYHPHSDRIEAQSATDYREQANTFLQKRGELYQKAQQYIQRGMTEVAHFYSGLAVQQTQLFDQANNFAVSAFLDEHSKRLQSFNTLDLHFLYVKEAIQALDVFIDRSIDLLRGSSKLSESLQIITGRGKRSENGVSKIKPAVISRLRKRQIQFVEMNPGLLKIKISVNTLPTNELY